MTLRMLSAIASVLVAGCGGGTSSGVSAPDMSPHGLVLVTYPSGASHANWP